ncbi:hypothetical protein DDZ14_16490 [Maritimibacter sp. 55A14]|uniref:NfeD family protein n=1 Tax=Maritimibacter sp. 55A14 TaxID=2174844 RepID=UPI000D61BE6A|nr:hypothetical protein [Maritimibacter sp. 55A14]PWE29929.1 hypothetical protein DDZ14_16490 [Maritimibacter sp. 55A14]
MIWQEWWVWIVAGLGLAMLELAVPGYVFLGTAAGSVVLGLVLWGEVPPAEWLGASLTNHLLFLAVVSVVVWVVLRRVVGVRKGQVKIWDRDINED